MMAVDGMALVGEVGPEIVFLPPGARIVMREATKKILFSPRVTPVVIVGSANTIGLSIKVSANTTGDLFFDTDVGIMSVWIGTAWDDIGPPNDDVALEIHRQYRRFDDCFLTGDGIDRLQPITCSCPYCGMSNPPDATECGADRWDGCGAPLGVQ